MPKRYKVELYRYDINYQDQGWSRDNDSDIIASSPLDALERACFGDYIYLPPASGGGKKFYGVSVDFGALPGHGAYVEYLVKTYVCAAESAKQAWAYVARSRPEVRGKRILGVHGVSVKAVSGELPQIEESAPSPLPLTVSVPLTSQPKSSSALLVNDDGEPLMWTCPYCGFDDSSLLPGTQARCYNCCRASSGD